MRAGLDFRTILSFGSLTALSLASTGCTAPATESAEAATESLIGGEHAENGEFPSTVVVAYEYTFPDGLKWRFPFCTAAKVGPRQLLIAAHCMISVDRELGEVGISPILQTGGRIFVTNQTDVDFATAELTELTVAEAHVFPEFRDACAADPATCSYVGGGTDFAPDVGVIEVEEEIPGIPVARVDLRPVLVGEPLAIQGFGCRDSVATQENYLQIELKWARTFAMPPDGSAYRDVFRQLTPAEYRERVTPNYVVTPGPMISPDQGGLCPGDSGGPIYRRQGRNDIIVGVNSSYGFTVDETGQNYVPIPLTNWHTRLDATAGSPVSRWLIERGVSVTFSPILGLYLELAECAEGFEPRYVGLGGLYCVDPETGRADSRMATLDMLTGCWDRRRAAGEDLALCYEPLWDVEEYLELRGDGFCAIGAHFDVRLGACVGDLFAQGQLPERVREACAEAGQPCEGAQPLMTTVHHGLATAPVHPIVECVRRHRDDSYTARFGYESEARRPVHIVPGPDNRFGEGGTGADRGQVADFMPGRNRRAFEVRFAASETLSWTLTGPDGSSETATASASSPLCR